MVLFTTTTTTTITTTTTTTFLLFLNMTADMVRNEIELVLL